jgi:hypothetical protein
LAALPGANTKLPAGQSAQGEQAAALVFMLKVLAGQLSHTRSLVMEPGATTN